MRLNAKHDKKEILKRLKSQWLNNLTELFIEFKRNVRICLT